MITVTYREKENTARSMQPQIYHDGPLSVEELAHGSRHPVTNGHNDEASGPEVLADLLTLVVFIADERWPHLWRLS